MTERRDEDMPIGADALDSFFAAARAHAPQPAERLMARIQTAGMAVASAARPAVPVAAPPGRAGWSLRAVVAALGGWGAVGGLATATAAGVWIGVAPPTALGEVAGALTASTVQVDSLDLMPGLDEVLTEG